MADEFVLFLCEDCPGEICYLGRQRLIHNGRDTCTCLPGHEAPKSRFKIGDYAEHKGANKVLVTKIDDVWFAFTDRFRFWYGTEINGVRIQVAECDLREVEIISTLGRLSERAGRE